ncbi:hypothetical protein [uncultured Paludibaculum sp.]|uniref:hypothetical protein n=1 Tax=uncultured Paludibaculum sp. TaxID=1765020 RepID=UPI002AAB29ED|nr:hypothetical protein [uncultured Paludibaculum sp.]
MSDLLTVFRKSKGEATRASSTELRMAAPAARSNEAALATLAVTPGWPGCEPRLANSRRAPTAFSPGRVNGF